MSPTVAIVLTIVFIVAVFKIDFRKEFRQSYALWIPLIWMMRSISKPFSFWVDPTTPPANPAMDIIEGNPIDRAIFIVLIFLSLIVLFRRKIDWRLFFKKNIWIVIWFSYCLISILWSDFPIVSLKRWIKEIGLFLGVLIILTEDDPILAVKTVIKKFSYILIPISIVLITYLPSLGLSVSRNTGEITYAGVSHNKNGLGQICMVSAFIFYYCLTTRGQTDLFQRSFAQKLIYLFFGVISLMLLLKVKSSTSLGALFVGISFLFAMRRRLLKHTTKILGIYFIAIVAVGIVLQYTVDIKDTLISFLGRDPTLTGRTLLWGDLLSLRTNPVIGVGFGNFWLGKRLAVIWKTQPWMPMESHNGFLNVYLELGTIGLSLMFINILVCYKRIKAVLLKNYEYGIFAFAILILTLLYNITEDSFGNISLMWFFFLFVLVDTSKRLKGESLNPKTGETKRI